MNGKGNVVDTHNGIYSAFKKIEILSFMTQMGLEDIMLREIS